VQTWSELKVIGSDWTGGGGILQLIECITARQRTSHLPNRQACQLVVARAQDGVQIDASGDFCGEQCTTGTRTPHQQCTAPLFIIAGSGSMRRIALEKIAAMSGEDSTQPFDSEAVGRREQWLPRKSCEASGEQEDLRETSRVMTLDEFSGYWPNEAWFTGVLSLLLLVIMRVRLLGHSALITLISRGREKGKRVCSQGAEVLLF